MAVARFGRAKRTWFRRFLALPHGIPLHDTFGRVFAALDPHAFHAAFLAWVESTATRFPGGGIAIDGRTLRRTFDTASQQAAIQTVSAWATVDLAWLSQRRRWPGLRSLLRVDSGRTLGTHTARKTWSFISSPPADAAHLARVVRGHWIIDNGLHWILDVALQQDHPCIRTGHAPENLATLHHIALNLLRQERTEKLGIKNTRLAAGWDHDCLLRVSMAARTCDATPLEPLPGHPRDRTVRVRCRLGRTMPGPALHREAGTRRLR